MNVKRNTAPVTLTAWGRIPHERGWGQAQNFLKRSVGHGLSVQIQFSLCGAYQDMPNRIETVFEAALLKYRQGEREHGMYDPVTDQRDMMQEAEEEILDAINYLAMFLMRIRAIRGGKSQPEQKVTF